MTVIRLLLILAVLAMSLTAAAPPADLSQPAKASDGRFWDSDYPRRAIIDRASGAVVIRMEIDPAGKIHRCKIVERSGVAALDDYSCKVAIVRFRFDPARDQTGQKIWGIKTQRINWKMKPKEAFEFNYFDYALRVKRLPQNAPSASVQLNVLIDAKGRPSACRIQISSGVTALDKAACSSLPSAGALLPVLDERGEPTISMQTLWLRFVAESAKPDAN